MTSQSLIMPEKSYKAALDLNIRKALHTRGDVLVWLTWSLHTGEACMVLTAKDRHTTHERLVPCIIPLHRAWVWDEAIGDEEQTNLSAVIFAANLGFNPENVKTIFKIKGIVRDYLGDLLSMPPLPSDSAQVAAEAVIHNATTGEEVFKEIKDHA